MRQAGGSELIHQKWMGDALVRQKVALEFVKVRLKRESDEVTSEGAEET